MSEGSEIEIDGWAVKRVFWTGEGYVPSTRHLGCAPSSAESICICPTCVAVLGADRCNYCSTKIPDRVLTLAKLIV